MAGVGGRLKKEGIYTFNCYHCCMAETNTTLLEKLLKEELSRRELSVIITKAPCVLLKGNVFKDKCQAEAEKCKKCGRCLSIGCPALTKCDDGTIKIDQTMCNGCGLCAKYCAFDAIKLVKGE